MPGSVLFQFRAAGDPPSIDAVAEQFGFTEAEIDGAYGVQRTADTDDLYLVRVDSAARDRLGAAIDAIPDRDVHFVADPRIEPFGPAEL